MESRVKSAVILAAGDGGRLPREIHDLPKGLIQFGEKPILEESIETLLGFGIEKIILVLGFRANCFQNLTDKFVCIKVVSNGVYDESGTAYSLYCARSGITGDFLLLESDLLYEPRAIDELLKYPWNDVTLLSGFTFAGDEVFVEARDQRLIGMSKDRHRLETIAGEFVGISKISFEFYQAMMDWSERRFKESLLVDYETDAMVSVCQQRPVVCHKIDDLLWCEIDDARHYANAKEKIYPKLRSKGRFFRAGVAGRRNLRRVGSTKGGFCEK